MILKARLDVAGMPIITHGEIKPLEVTENGVYQLNPTDGYNPVTVAVPLPELEDLTITENGNYKSDLYGYNQVTVDVQPTLEEVTLSANGIYQPTGFDGWNKVVVDIPSEYENGEEMRW